jgi:outer membrane protein assembly factor BamA
VKCKADISLFLHFTICCFIFCSLLSLPSQLKAEALHVNQITLLGAQKTRPFIILRELTFQKADTISSAALEKVLQKSQQNIYNLGLFTEVKLVPQVNFGQLSVIISVQERWYIFGSPVFRLDERNNYDIWRAIWNLDLQRAVFGANLTWRNVTGQNETLIFSGLIGYKQRLAIDYRLPAAFRKANIDLRVGFSYRQQNELLIGTDSARVVRGRLETTPLERSWSGVVGLQKRFSPYQNLYLELNYQHRQFADSLYNFLIDENPNPLLPGFEGQAFYPTLKVEWIEDRRDYRAFPLSGYKYQLQFRYSGPKIGQFSNLHMARLGASWAQHIAFTDRWNLAFGTQHLLTIGDSIPWYEKSFVGIGTRDFGGSSTELRGYEPYAIAGTYVMMNKAEVKYGVLPRRMLHLDWLPLRKFQDLPIGVYLSAFCDAGYVRDNSFSRQDPYMLDRWLVGYGVGLNVIGFYDMLARIEYARNHLGEGGIYVNATVPIK